MKMKAVLLVVGLCSLNTGCVYYLNAARNLTEAPIDAVDNLHICGRNHRLAKEAWNSVRTSAPHTSSHDYAKGFKQGYADYLDAGGKGLPPEVPPYCYRKSHHQTPEGIRAIEDWFAGFRHGTATARDSGYREAFVLPIATPGPYPEYDSSVKLALQLPTPASAPAEPLPVPRKVTAPAQTGKEPPAPPKVVPPDSKAGTPAKGSILFEGKDPASSSKQHAPAASPKRPTQGTLLFEKS